MLIELSATIEHIVSQQAQKQGITAQQFVEQTISKQYMTENPFNYDMDKMQTAINSGFTPPVPNHALTDLATFENWLKGV
ncbi:hypothetical protein ACGTJS_11465 [Faucicola mancuniensis]|uniref:hypothetical protein n=1 Tax=Faucicola mancuniensis TaxID=1309795 RepID=UPI0028EC2214|nr:hypothetical protein [uncultured Moraxella sp.]